MIQFLFVFFFVWKKHAPGIHSCSRCGVVDCQEENRAETIITCWRQRHSCRQRGEREFEAICRPAGRKSPSCGPLGVRLCWQDTQSILFETDTQRGVATGLSRGRNLRSKIWWFTEFCNSHYLSHFAAFFIVTRTKISIAYSCWLFRICFVQLAHESGHRHSTIGLVDLGVS